MTPVVRAHLDPLPLDAARAADARGVDIIENCEVTAIRTTGGRVVGVETAEPGGRAEGGKSAGLDPSVIPWLKQRDIAILGVRPDYIRELRGAGLSQPISATGLFPGAAGQIISTVLPAPLRRSRISSDSNCRTR